MRNYPKVGIQVADILLPKPGTELAKWAVIACDQFTSQPEYWDDVKNLVGDRPSTFHMVLPEVYLGTEEETNRIQTTQACMNDYLDKGIFKTHEGLIYVERTVSGKTRHGLMLALDLEQYDFNKGSKTLVRATEGTILDRLPPRIRIREGAPLEIPHILVLIDDPDRTVIESIGKRKDDLKKVYDFELMAGSGHLSGYMVNDKDLEEKVIAGLGALADPKTFLKKYNLTNEEGVLLYAVGDGNHSLATAKAIWEKIKTSVGMDHPARYALVEIENIHDEGLDFEPIHRVLFGLTEDPLLALRTYFGSSFTSTSCRNEEEMICLVKTQQGHDQSFGLITPAGFNLITITEPTHTIPVGTLQVFLDAWLKNGGAKKIDYVHGDRVVCTLGAEDGNAGFYLPSMQKGDLFKTVIVDGALPRKTFSMGEAHEKRFYMECRKISK
ncbi:MAG: DUF1015 domain-containing protein [Anaerolineaceae bacterium]|nr:DUF1015 domain-containing protein [Anaerolineaceae bacterium]